VFLRELVERERGFITILMAKYLSVFSRSRQSLSCSPDYPDLCSNYVSPSLSVSAGEVNITFLVLAVA